MIPTVPWLREKFTEYNAKYFGNKLPVPQFRIERMSDRFGNYFLDARFNKSNRRIFNVNGTGVLTLTSQFDRPERSVTNTLLHEMTHEYVYLVMGICPQDRHGREFMSIANRINADGWQIGVGAELTQDDIETDGNETRQGILFIINAPERTDFKWWVCKADANNRQGFVAAAKKIEGVRILGFYSCNSGALEHVKSDPSTLFGWGGMNYEEAVGKLADYCGERPQVFYGKNLTKIK